MKKNIVGLGEILWDIFPEKKILGGAPANFAYHVSQFGFNGSAVSAIGEDLLGKEILTALEEKELNYLIETTDYPTGTVQVTLNAAGVPEYEICENVAWDNIPFTARTENLAKNTDTVCFGSLAQRNEVSRDTIRRFIQAMPEKSLKIFDINMRLNYFTREVIHESLQLANMLKMNDDEIIRITELFGWEGSEQEICRKILEAYNLRVLIFTKGTDGSFVMTPDTTSFQSTPKVKVADTVGAGDSFTAAFTAAYLHGEKIEEAHKLATEVAAYICLQHGAMPKLPDAYRELFR
ncbi:MAG: carbohydrate kinase [Bacteroides sp.]|nr:carbohydrate kinase [Bacteroides sp.]